jgi:hypothetical protein
MPLKFSQAVAPREKAGMAVSLASGNSHGAMRNFILPDLGYACAANIALQHAGICRDNGKLWR